MASVLLVVGQHVLTNSVALDWLERGAVEVKLRNGNLILLEHEVQQHEEVVIRTTDENIISLMRALRAEDRINHLLLVGADISGGECMVLPFDEYGMAGNWPNWFMAESLELSTRILKAQMKARKARRDPFVAKEG